MTTTTKPAKKTMSCPKCGGTGHIPRYAGIANGDCFTCGATGKVAYRVRKQVMKPLTPYQAEMIEKVRTDDFSTMGYGELLKVRDFAHWHYPQAPDLLDVWRERGEEFFQAAQARKLEAMYA